MTDLTDLQHADPTFPPSDASLGEGLHAVGWARLSELLPDLPLIDGTAGFDGVQQGAHNDCFLLCACALVATQPSSTAAPTASWATPSTSTTRPATR